MRSDGVTRAETFDEGVKLNERKSRKVPDNYSKQYKCDNQTEVRGIKGTDKRQRTRKKTKAETRGELKLLY